MKNLEISAKSVSWRDVPKTLVGAVIVGWIFGPDTANQFLADATTSTLAIYATVVVVIILAGSIVLKRMETVRRSTEFKHGALPFHITLGRELTAGSCGLSLVGAFILLDEFTSRLSENGQVANIVDYVEFVIGGAFVLWVFRLSWQRLGRKED